MKKTLSLILALAVFVSVFALMATASAEDKPWYVKTDNGKTLNLREGPSKDSKVILRIPYGDEFWVFETRSDGWAYGHWGGQFGYVMTRYLSQTKPGPKPTEAPQTEEEKQAAEEQKKLNKELKSETEVSEPFYIAVRATRTSGWINFRVGPSKITGWLSAFPDGKELIVIGETTNWYHARDPESGKVGYIHKNYTTKLVKPVTYGTETEGSQQLGKLAVNGEFNITCKIPEGYKLESVDVQGGVISASVLPEDITRPELYLMIAYDEQYGEVNRLNDLSNEELAALEATFTELNDVDITYRQTGYGTKLMIAQEKGTDADFVDILTIYKGYMVEFRMIPNPQIQDQTLTAEQIQMCIDFLTNVDFVEAAQP